MKLIVSLTSPFARKIRVILAEKGLPCDLQVDIPWLAETNVPDYNPLGKVPVLVADDGEVWFDSPVIAEYLETLGGPALLPADRVASLPVRQSEALADGITDAAVSAFLEMRRPAPQQDIFVLRFHHGFSQLAMAVFLPLVVGKYADHCPLERQSRIFCQRYGITLSASTLGDWVGGSAQVLEPLYKELLRRVVSRSHLSLDDTPVRVLDKAHAKGIKRGHLWSLVSDDEVVYFYTPTWHGAPLVELLKDFDGVLQSDGYSGLNPLYQKLPRAPKRAGCMAHARRRFVRALEAGDARAAIPLALIRKLYKIEAQATDQGMDNAARLQLRQSQSVPLMVQLDKEVRRLGAQAPPKTLLGQAVGYAVRQWSTLETFLHDGAVRIDNNHVERTLRPIGTGRHNWLFGGSDQGARWLAIHQTLLGTCLLLGVRDPWEYLRDILTKLARGWPQSRLGELLPGPWLAARTPQAQPAPPSPA